MSISASLSNAISGLAATARSAQIISSNIANAMTEGYARRELELGVRGQGFGGVRMGGILRHTQPTILADRRIADAGLNAASTGLDFLRSLENLYGDPTQAGSLTGMFAEFEARLVQVEADPGSDILLAQVLQGAQKVAGRIAEISDGIQDMRVRADQDIGASVQNLNRSLAHIEALNIRIVEAQVSGQDPSGLIDQRQLAIDAVSDLVPVREVPRQDGSVAIFTTGGAILLDGKAAEIGFEPSGLITPHMTREGGHLSGLTISGNPVSTQENGVLGGGKLTAQFAVRDRLSVNSQAQLDAVARDLVERFQNGADPTLAPGAAGLFTDAGSAFDTADETGLAGRLQINTLVDPDAGGALWRLRDGLGATAPGPVGNASVLTGLRAALEFSRPPASGVFGAGTYSAAGIFAELVSQTAATAADQELEQGYAAAWQGGLKMQELSAGVDTDHELQRLMVIEKLYAANAKVIEAVDEMLQSIIRM